MSYAPPPSFLFPRSHPPHPSKYRAHSHPPPPFIQLTICLPKFNDLERPLFPNSLPPFLIEPRVKRPFPPHLSRDPYPSPPLFYCSKVCPSSFISLPVSFQRDLVPLKGLGSAPPFFSADSSSGPLSPFSFFSSVIRMRMEAPFFSMLSRDDHVVSPFFFFFPASAL